MLHLKIEPSFLEYIEYHTCQHIFLLKKKFYDEHYLNLLIHLHFNAKPNYSDNEISQK